MDVATELDRLIERRAPRQPDPDELEASYMESVRRYHARQHQAELWERLRFHEAMLRAHRQSFREIVRRHRAALAAVEQELGISGGGDAA